MTDDTDLNPDGKPWFRLADAEDIANLSTAFTLPGRLAKLLADRQKRIARQQAAPGSSYGNWQGHYASLSD